MIGERVRLSLETPHNRSVIFGSIPTLAFNGGTLALSRPTKRWCKAILCVASLERVFDTIPWSKLFATNVYLHTFKLKGVDIPTFVAESSAPLRYQRILLQLTHLVCSVMVLAGTRGLLLWLVCRCDADIFEFWAL